MLPPTVIANGEQSLSHIDAWVGCYGVIEAVLVPQDVVLLTCA